jgi:hypothetical protein
VRKKGEGGEREGEGHEGGRARERREGGREGGEEGERIWSTDSTTITDAS